MSASGEMIRSAVTWSAVTSMLTISTVSLIAASRVQGRMRRAVSHIRRDRHLPGQRGLHLPRAIRELQVPHAGYRQPLAVDGFEHYVNDVGLSDGTGQRDDLVTRRPVANLGFRYDTSQVHRLLLVKQREPHPHAIATV